MERGFPAWPKKVRSGPSLKEDKGNLDGAETRRGVQRVAVPIVDIGTSGQEHSHERNRRACGQCPTEHLVAHVVERVSQVFATVNPTNQRIGLLSVAREYPLDRGDITRVNCSFNVYDPNSSIGKSRCRRTSELSGRGNYIQPSIQTIKLRNTLPALRSDDLLGGLASLTIASDRITPQMRR